MTGMVFLLAQACATACLSQAASPDEVLGKKESSSSEIATARLDWSGAVRLQIESTPDEIVLRFDRPPPSGAIEHFASTVATRVADLRWNDDSLVLRVPLQYRVYAAVDGQGVTVQFMQEHESGESADATNSIQEKNLVRAQIDAAAGYPGKARRQLMSMARLDPDNAQVARSLADAEVADGAIGIAAERYRAMAADDVSAQRVIAEASGSLAAGWSIRSGDDFSQRELRLIDAAVPFRPDLVIGGALRHVWTRADTVNGPSGQLFHQRSNSTFADLMSRFVLSPWSTLIVQGSAQIRPTSAGVGARLFVGSLERQLRLNLAYRLPDVSTAEQSIFGGKLSRMGAGAMLRLTPNLVTQADLSWNIYRIVGRPGRTSTITAAGGVDYLLRRKSPSLTFSYRLDGEYVLSTSRRSNGSAFIPLSSRENHTLQLVPSFALADLQLTGAFGWTEDRYGGGGPTAGLGAVWRSGDAWRLEANGGVSSISRPAVSGRQLYLRIMITRYLVRL